MPESTLTKGDLLEVVSDFRTHVDGRFEALATETNGRIDKINDHLRTLNGSVARHEALHAALQVEIGWLKQQQTATVGAHATPAAPAVSPDERPALTKGDIKHAWAWAAGLVALIEVVRTLWPYAAAMSQVH